MSSSISFSLSSAAYAKTAQNVHTVNDQQAAVRQQLAEASLNGVYGPPYILDVSLANAVGDEPLPGSLPAEETLQSSFAQLSQSLQSGNLPAAQQAFSSLVKIPKVQAKLQDQLTGASNDPLAKALNQVSSALRAGNVQAAQQAFSALGDG